MILFSSRVWNLDLGVCERFPFDALCRSPWPLIYPCSFFLWNSLKANSQTDSLMAKKEVLTHTHDAIASRQQYIDLSAKSAVLYQSKKSRFINTRLIKMDSWGLLLLSFQTGCAPGPQPHWLVKCHAVLSQMVKNCACSSPWPQIFLATLLWHSVWVQKKE